MCQSCHNLALPLCEQKKCVEEPKEPKKKTQNRFISSGMFYNDCFPYNVKGSKKYLDMSSMYRVKIQVLSFF